MIWCPINSFVNGHVVSNKTDLSLNKYPSLDSYESKRKVIDNSNYQHDLQLLVFSLFILLINDMGPHTQHK